MCDFLDSPVVDTEPRTAILLLTSTIGDDQGLEDGSITFCFCISMVAFILCQRELPRRLSAFPVLMWCRTRSVHPRLQGSVEKISA